MIKRVVYVTVLVTVFLFFAVSFSPEGAQSQLYAPPGYTEEGGSATKCREDFAGNINCKTYKKKTGPSPIAKALEGVTTCAGTTHQRNKNR